MQYLVIVIVFVAILVILPVFVAAKRTQRGMQIWKNCESRYGELIQQGIENRDALILISKEHYPQLSDETHNKLMNKCHDVRQLANFLSVVFANPRPKSWSSTGPLSNAEATALINSTTVSEIGQISTNYHKAGDELGI